MEKNSIDFQRSAQWVRGKVILLGIALSLIAIPAFAKGPIISASDPSLWDILLAVFFLR